MAIWTWIVLAIILLLIIVLILGFRPLQVSRKVSFVGIEDNEVALAYDRISRWPQFKAIRWLVTHELRSRNPHGTLVDIGCGPGYLIITLLKALPHLSIIGVDIADEMVQKATTNVSSLGLLNKVSFRRGNTQALPFETSSIDFVVSTLSLHHWTEPKQALNEIYRVLKPEGQFLIFDLRRNSPRLFYWLIKFAQGFVLPPVMRQVNEPVNSLLASYTTSEMKTLLSGTSFEHWNVKPGIGWLFAWGRKE